VLGLILAKRPEHGVHDGDDDQEDQHGQPNKLQQVSDDHEDSTRNSTAHSAAPGTIHLVPGCACCEAAQEQYH